MISLTEKEKKALLILFKDFTAFYNAHTLNKILGISHAGAQKLCKRLLGEHLLQSKKIGKSIVYKPNLENDYMQQLIVFLLADEANRFRRWKEEFRTLHKKGSVIMLYGSALKNYAEARDIDIMLVIDKQNAKEVNKALKEKASVLPKPLHAIKLTHEDLLNNIRKRNKAIVDIVKNAVVLYGQEAYVETIKHVTSI